ncbi:sulfotransferase family protein [Pseudooceanicola sp. CBS1P-1]|uniref:Sulfotransferase family protein n=2 Tax=Paracoccaceae TaxID=31989 RepID=A0A6L7FZ05_9RHOB|nr:sulfotransferase family protein [Pseudooceanicola endophyticus]MXN17021.1 sulfotransferase family protein [Pseudooceanicola albus]
MQVINLGLPKSGTTSFARAMKAAGLKVADHRIRRGQTADPALWRSFVGMALYRGHFGNGDPLRDLGDFQAIAECSFLQGRRSAWPQMDFALIAAIRDRHPQVRFVATWRPPEALADSMRRWTNMATRLEAASLPGLPEGFGADPGQLARWIAGHHAHLHMLFAGSDRFLELDVADPAAQDRLAGFLGRDLPWWGRANANTRRPSPA